MARSDSTPAGPMPAGRSMPQIIALAFGVVYTLFGLVGLLLTGFDGNFAGHDGESLLGFEVNPLHNLVHLGVGVLGIAMARKLATARTYGWILFVVFGAVFLFGLFAVGNDDINFLAINGADNVLHLINTLIGLAIALWPVRSQVQTAERQLQGMRRR